MKLPLRFATLAFTYGLIVGCGSQQPTEPPKMTPELQAQIDAEDAAIEEEERANAKR